MNRKIVFWVALWAILIVVTGLLAFGSGPGSMGYGPWHGWGRMGGWNDDFRAEGAYGGYGMGPGMMGGMEAGRGWGMPYGMMMGRHGAGMPGMGPGFMYGSMMGNDYAMAPVRLPGLTPEQSRKIDQLQSEADERNSLLAQQSWAAQTKLNRMQISEKRDWNEIRSASRALMDLQRQQLDASINLQQKIDGLLTEKQRLEMARIWRGYGWMGAQ